MKTKTLHFGVNNITRSEGHNAVAALAYRSGYKLYDQKEEKYHDYRDKSGVIRSQIFAPDNAPGWMMGNDNPTNWERFANEIERKEDSHNRRASALLGKDFIAAAPRELTQTQHWQLAEGFARKLNDRGLAVAVAYHETNAEDGGKNPHFHFMVAMRHVDENGFGKRYRDLDAPGKKKQNPELMKLRREYYHLVNEALEEAGVKGVTYDSEKQEDKIPGRHKGKDATAREKKGEDTRVAQYNRKVKFDNFMQKYEKSASPDGWINPPAISKHDWNERVEGWRMNRGSSMAARDLSRRSQSNVATPPVNRSDKATEIARDRAIHLTQQSQSESWRERVGRSRQDVDKSPQLQPKPPVQPQPQSFQERIKKPNSDMEKT